MSFALVLLMYVRKFEGVVSVADSSTCALKNPPIFNHPTALMSQVLSRWKLKMNWLKMRVMKVARKTGQSEVKGGDQVIEQVDEMKYLGVMISSDGSMEKKVEVRIGRA